VVDRGVLAEQIAYYRARAAEYDDAYGRVNQYDRGEARNAEWHRALDELVRRVDAVPIAGDVVELGGGTGFWTERLARRARQVTVIDAAPEALALNRERVGGAGVSHVAADLMGWTPPRRWDVCFTAFFLNHVPDSHLAAVVRAAVASVGPGGTVVVVDEAPRSAAAGEVADRVLNDGRAYRIVKHARSADEWVAVFAAHGASLTVTEVGGRFLLAVTHVTE